MTQRELAARAGMSTAAIRDLEQGRTRSPKPDSVSAIAAALRLNAPDLATLSSATDRPLGTKPDGSGDGRLRINVLGPIEVWRGDLRVPLRSDRRRTLLARLALGGGAVVSHDELVGLLWEDVPANPVSLLQTHVVRLRRLLTGATGGQVVVGDRAGYRLAVTAGQLDLLQFRDLVDRARHESPEQGFARLAEAVALWRGEPDLARINESPLFTALRAEFAGTVRSFAVLARELANPEPALPALRAAVAGHDLDEPLHTELILTLAASGQQTEALATYARVRTALAEQIGIDPGQPLREAHLAVLRQMASRAAVRTTLQQAPAPPPDFVGRTTELAAISAVFTGNPLAPPPVSGRIVVVHGIAGVGKTALVLAAAHRLRASYPDGQLYADLRGDADDPMPSTALMRVLGRFLRALGVPATRIGTDESEAAAVFRSELASRRMLVLLDNAGDTARIRALLPGAGPSDVLVTSRRMLPELAATSVVELTPLTRYESVALIAATAGSHRVNVDRGAAEELADACARLPLALRIAGARLATRPAWAIGDLVGRLRDDNRRLAELSSGESSVLSSFQLGYADLSPVARRAFRLCGSHPGPDFGARAVGVLLDLPVEEADRVLEELLEANMLMQYDSDRYRFHDLLGLYARRLLAADDEAEAARSRLNAWCAEAVTAAMEWVYPQLVRLATHPAKESFFACENDALAWLDLETPTLLAVIDQVAMTVDAELSWRIADQLRGYFLIRRQADRWLPAAETGLAAARRAGDDRARVAMLISRGQALAAVGRDDDALTDCLDGEAIATSSGWTAAAAYLSHHVGWLHLDRGDFAEAARWLHKALRLTEGDDESHVRAVALNGFGVLRLDQGDLTEAVDLFTAALKINETTGRRSSALANRGNLAGALRQLGDVTTAEDHLAAVLSGYRHEANPRGELSTLDEWSRLLGQRGDHTAALDRARQAHDIAVLIRDVHAEAKTAGTVATALLGAGRLSDAITWFGRCLSIAGTRYPYLEAQALIGMARTRLALGDATSSRTAIDRAADVATRCGFRLLRAQAMAVSAELAGRAGSPPPLLERQF